MEKKNKTLSTLATLYIVASVLSLIFFLTVESPLTSSDGLGMGTAIFVIYAYFGTAIALVLGTTFFIAALVRRLHLWWLVSLSLIIILHAIFMFHLYTNYYRYIPSIS